MGVHGCGGVHDTQGNAKKDIHNEKKIFQDILCRYDRENFPEHHIL